MAVIKGYLDSIGQTNRNIVLIPSSAHGTNPASAVMAGLKVVVVKCDELGDIDINDLKVGPPGNEPGPNAFQAFVRTSYTRDPHIKI